MSKIFKQRAAYLHQENKRHTAELLPIEFDRLSGCIAAWRSNRFLVQLFAAADGAQRITICRTSIDVVTGRWLDGITWQEIQDIKRAIGFGDRDAVEIYPADADVVNVANMRHIWLVDLVAFAWRRNG